MVHLIFFSNSNIIWSFHIHFIWPFWSLWVIWASRDLKSKENFKMTKLVSLFGPFWNLFAKHAYHVNYLCFSHFGPLRGPSGIRVIAIKFTKFSAAKNLSHKRNFYCKVPPLFQLWVSLEHWKFFHFYDPDGLTKELFDYDSLTCGT